MTASGDTLWVPVVSPIIGAVLAAVVYWLVIRGFVAEGCMITHGGSRLKLLSHVTTIVKLLLNMLLNVRSGMMCQTIFRFWLFYTLMKKLSVLMMLAVVGMMLCDLLTPPRVVSDVAVTAVKAKRRLQFHDQRSLL